jgi:hypothetical protein
LAFDASLHITKQEAVALLFKGFFLLVDALLVAFFLEVLLSAELVLPEASGSANVFFQRNSLRKYLLFL